MKATAAELVPVVGYRSITIREMSGKIDDAWHTQWTAAKLRTPPDGGWDWPYKRKHYDYVSALKVAMWADDETVLCGLMLARLNNTACVVDMLEGNPDPRHPLKGRVAFLGLDIAARYAQLNGRRELWINDPANDRLIELYVSGYDFEHVKPKGRPPYCRRALVTS